MITNVWQRALLALGVLTLLVLIVEIVLSVAATMHGSVPARVTQVTAGPYALNVSLYKDPAEAGFALPFAIAPRTAVKGVLTYEVTTIPAKEVNATPVRASIAPDANVVNGVQGAAEITVQGPWSLHIIVMGSDGRGEVDVPLRVVGPTAIPLWLGWLIGCIPLYGLLVFLLMQREKKKELAKDQEPVMNSDSVVEAINH